MPRCKKCNKHISMKRWRRHKRECENKKFKKDFFDHRPIMIPTIFTETELQAFKEINEINEATAKKVKEEEE